MQPTVSIIVPMYNVECYIERCARSIFSQSYSNLEIVFVNDCSTDDSVLVLEKILAYYPTRKKQVKIIHHLRNQGVAQARITGMRNCAGDYLIQFDSDDWVEENMIELMVHIAENDDADITICDYNIVRGNTFKHVKINPPLNNIACMKAVLSGEIHASLCNKLIRRELYTMNNIYPTEGLNQLEDLSIMYKLLYFANKIAYIDKALYFYSADNPSSYTHIKMDARKQLNYLQVLQQMDDFRLQYGPFEEKLELSFLYNKALRLSTIVLYGDINDLRKYKAMFKEVSLKIIWSQPFMKAPLKVAGLLYKTNCIVFLCVLKFVQKMWALCRG